jgi:hypothetical protein
MATVAKFPNRNVQLRHGARIIKRHDGEPKPDPPKDPNLKAWSVHLIGGKKLIFLGVVEGVSEPAAIEAGVALFNLDDLRRRRLAIKAVASMR